MLDLVRLVDQRIEQRVRRLARPVRGLLVSARDATGRLVAVATGRAGETLNGGEVELAQHFGFASRPPPATELIGVPVGGSSGHQVVVGELDIVHRPKDLNDGESALYGVAGNQVRINVDGSVEIRTAAGTGVQVTSAGQVLLDGGGAPVARVGDTVTITGVDSLSGDITATGVIASGSTTVQAGG